MEQNYKIKEKQNLNYRLILLEKLKLSFKRELLLLLAFSLASIVGRIILQNVPSVEPIIAFSSFVGFFFGPLKGLFVGSSSFYISNFFVWGGQGIWSLFQSIGAGTARLIGGLLGKFSKNRYNFILSSILGCIFYEIIVTIPMGVLSPLNLLFYILTSIPFSLVHIISTIGFSIILYEFRKIEKWRWLSFEKTILGVGYSNIDNFNNSRGISQPKWRKVFIIRKTKNKNRSGFWIVERK